MFSMPPDLARSALDAAPDAFIIIDAAGLVQFANRQASVLFGCGHDEIVGHSVEQLMPERFRHQHVAHRMGYMEVLRLRPMGVGLALFGRRRDGSEFPVEISLSPVASGGQMLVAAAIRDVSDRKRVEVELRLAREEADRANQAKSRFLATASHDLRQPLQTLALLNGTLRRVATSEAAIEALQQQEQAINAMSRLLGALLDISKLDSGGVKPELADFKVAVLFEDLRREFASIAASKNLELRVEACEEWIHSDPGLVEQIMKNLVANAIKYTQRGRVLVRAVCVGPSVRVDVIDTGIGIPAAQLSYIYDEFYQVGVPTNSPRDGYGLGLSIVQRLVGLLDLRLEVTSEVGKGSTFSLLLPTGNRGAVRSAAAVQGLTTSHAERRRILLVEDEPGVRDATRMLLKVEGYRVTAVASLSEALTSVREEGVPALVVTDYHLGQGELGTQVIAALRQGFAPDLKAVLITGDTSTAIKQLPDDPHVRVASKPINAEELLGLIDTLLIV